MFVQSQISPKFCEKSEARRVELRLSNDYLSSKTHIVEGEKARSEDPSYAYPNEEANIRVLKHILEGENQGPKSRAVLIQ